MLQLAMAGSTPWSWGHTVGDGTTYWGYSDLLGVGTSTPTDPPANDDGQVRGLYSHNSYDIVLEITGNAGAPAQNSIASIIASGGNGAKSYATADADEYETSGSTAIWRWGDGSNKVWDSGDIGLSFTQAVSF